MADLGFWNFARRDPSQLALVDPDGREWTRGELLARCNQVVHGLRALGLEKGDCVATVLPNGAPMIELIWPPPRPVGS
jgi:long-chain acyl-CoA synthetase